MIVDTKARWEAAYREEAPRLWRALLLATGSPEVASDVMAEAFAQGIARGDQVRAPGAWVWRAAFAIAGGELQRMRWPPEAIPDPEIPAPESVIDLTRALRGLPHRQRVVTVLHYYGGYSLGEIASIVGSSRSSVGVHLYRARKALRKELEGEADD
ncbi:MAG: sigma-70 family RNA polymerase sigma factor [Actinobacteria bacterium]|nr:sigma-70 family RNA polymerase sigma factor [Actinomycetota bacterium]